jgi:hypothetical protein
VWKDGNAGPIPSKKRGTLKMYFKEAFKKAQKPVPSKNLKTNSWRSFFKK